MSIGFATEVDDKGVRKGVVLRPFEYTQKRIIYMKKTEQYTKKAIRAVKKMASKEARRAGWLIDTRDGDKSLYSNDPISRLLNIRSNTVDKFEYGGIKEISDLASIEDAQLDLFATHIDLSVQAFKRWRDKARQASDKPSPHRKIDYRKADNPYLERYGFGEWEEQVFKSSHFRGVVSIKSLVRHIYKVTQQHFLNSPFCRSFYFAHDALSQMKDKRCLKWMQDEGLLKHWIRPVMGISDVVQYEDTDGVTYSSSNFAGRPPGDSPELMPNDNSLFRDLRCALDICVALTTHLPESDKRRFSKATPKEISRAIHRLIDTSPRPERILQDIERIPNALRQIVLHEGGVVPGLADRNGRRQQKRTSVPVAVSEPANQIDPFDIDTDDESESAVEEKELVKTFQDLGIHPDVQEVAWELIADERKKFDASMLQRPAKSELN